MRRSNSLRGGEGTETTAMDMASALLSITNLSALPSPSQVVPTPLFRMSDLGSNPDRLHLNNTRRDIQQRQISRNV